MLPDLFADERRDVDSARASRFFSGFARDVADDLIDQVRAMSGISLFRNMETRGGKRMSVAMFNCGSLGWVSDRSGYRYDAIDPDNRIVCTNRLCRQLLSVLANS